MANRFYPKALNKFIRGEIDAVNASLKVYCVNTNIYIPDFDTDEFLSAVPLNARVAEALLLGKSDLPNGAFDANDVNFIKVTGAQVGALVIVKYTGIAESSALICYIDDAVITINGVPQTFPFTPTGENVSLSWPNEGIFQI